MNKKNEPTLQTGELEKLRNAIASGELVPDLHNINDYSDIDNLFFAVDIHNIREAAVLALAICKCIGVTNTEITVFNAEPKLFSEESVLPRDYILDKAAKHLEELCADGTEAEFVKEYKTLLFRGIASGIHVTGDVFGGAPYRLTYGYLKDSDVATAQISFSGNPNRENAEALLDEIFAEFELLRDYLRNQVVK